MNIQYFFLFCAAFSALHASSKSLTDRTKRMDRISDQTTGPVVWEKFSTKVMSFRGDSRLDRLFGPEFVEEQRVKISVNSAGGMCIFKTVLSSSKERQQQATWMKIIQNSKQPLALRYNVAKTAAYKLLHSRYSSVTRDYSGKLHPPINEKEIRNLVRVLNLLLGESAISDDQKQSLREIVVLLSDRLL